MRKIIKHKIGDKMYIPSAFYISRGSDDKIGGLVTIKSFDVKEDFPDDHCNKVMVCFSEFPATNYNYKSLLEQQWELKKEFGDSIAYNKPDIDTPWIESGDTVNGKVYNGEDIW
jgi:hypothetical protein